MMLRAWLAALAAAAVVWLGVGPAMARQASLEAYSRLPELQSVSISPNGERLAFFGGAERDETYVYVTALDGGENVVVEAFSEDIEDQLLFSVGWVSDDHLLLVYRQRLLVPGAGAEDADIGKQVIFDVEDRQYREIDIGAVTVIDLLSEDPEHVLLSGPSVEVRTSSNSLMASRGDNYGANTPINLFRYNIETGRARIISRGDVDTVNWVLDENAEPVLRQDLDEEDRVWRVYARNGNNWRVVYTERFETERFGRDGRRYISRIGGLAGLDVDGRGAWFANRADNDMIRAFLFDPEQGEVSGPVIAPERFDMGGFRRDWRTRKIIGAAWTAERRQVEWFDPEFAALQAQLDGLFPTSDIVIADWDAAGNRFVIQVIGGEASTDYYLLDRAAGQLAFLQTQYPEVPADRVHPVDIVQYEAGDGLQLWGYLTRPVDRPAENLPLILLPHGGPQARDFYGFDFWAQPLAELGYAVFQPQFRGSEGMGRRFIERGHGEWGRRMQSDLGDGVSHLVESGVVDAERVCIFGWSYGGYAALAGYAFTPELYRCAIAGAPVSDIPVMMQYEEDRQGGASVNYWTEYIGDWRTERDLMVSISPARNVVRSDMPLLLIHGEEDRIVPIEQAEIMADAMRAAGNPVEFVRISGDGHNLLFRRTRLATIEAVADFVLEHNPPD